MQDVAGGSPAREDFRPPWRVGRSGVDKPSSTSTSADNTVQLKEQAVEVQVGGGFASGLLKPSRAPEADGERH